jgi:hypothetical protein
MPADSSASALPPIFTRGRVVEIQGHAGSGTNALYLLIARLLVHIHVGQDLRKSIALFDSGPTFDIVRFRGILIDELVHHTSSSNLENAADAAISALHVFRPTSSLHLASTLAALPAYLASYSAQSELVMVIVDSISDFYWPDRFSMEQDESSRSHGEALAPMIHPLRHALGALETVRRTYSPSMVITNWALTPVPRSLFYRNHLHPYLSGFEGLPARRGQTMEEPQTADAGIIGVQGPGAHFNPQTSLVVHHHITFTTPRVTVASVDTSLEDIRRTELEEEAVLRSQGIVRHVDLPSDNFEMKIGEHIIIKNL